MKTIIEPFHIKSVEPIRINTLPERQEALRKAHDNLFTIPDLSVYDPQKDEEFEWEGDVRAVIEKLRAENPAKEQAKDSENDGSE